MRILVEALDGDQLHLHVREVHDKLLNDSGHLAAVLNGEADQGCAASCENAVVLKHRLKLVEAVQKEAYESHPQSDPQLQRPFHESGPLVLLQVQQASAQNLLLGGVCPNCDTSGHCISHLLVDLGLRHQEEALNLADRVSVVAGEVLHQQNDQRKEPDGHGVRERQDHGVPQEVEHSANDNTENVGHCSIHYRNVRGETVQNPSRRVGVPPVKGSSEGADKSRCEDLLGSSDAADDFQCVAREVGDEEAKDQACVDLQQGARLRRGLDSQLLQPLIHERCLFLVRGPIRDPEVAEVLENHDAGQRDEHDREVHVAHGLEIEKVRGALHMASHTAFLCLQRPTDLLLLGEGRLRLCFRELRRFRRGSKAPDGVLVGRGGSGSLRSCGGLIIHVLWVAHHG
mmetsp:Transcript_46956/g.105444  ORF Transcript_46956/g.105444 Transcript_46956/m.105444 type:complete len:400 (-) Transcript_46956:531-1730(-)